MIKIRKRVYCIIHCSVDGCGVTVLEVLIFNKYVQLVYYLIEGDVGVFLKFVCAMQ